MNAGLSNLATLKTQIMPPAMRSRTDFDDQLVTLGLGVALLINGFCNRLLTRVEDDTFRISANNLTISLPRYPLEEVTSVTLSSDGTSTAITTDIVRTDLAAGLIHFDSVPGAQHDELIIVYSGGYWFDSTEDESGTLPTGATALPADLQTAFFLQMRHEVEQHRLFGLGAADDGKSKSSNAPQGLLETVKQILLPHRRFV
jgi:hypothetical protein